MKVVLFCGGFGMRLRGFSESVPKPLVQIGHRPILWHVMKYYAHFGHKDFILCLGWKGSEIKDYFLRYSECMSNDFVLRAGGAKIDLMNSDIHDWNITFVDTGPSASVGERLVAVKSHLAGEETFLANYTDGLSDLPLPDEIDLFQSTQSVASFVSVRPSHSFHSVSMDDQGHVEEIQSIGESSVWINGGYFVLGREIFDYIKPGEDLVGEPFQRLIAEQRLSTFCYDGFWSCMDTYKEMQNLEDIHAQGAPPWKVWRPSTCRS